MQNVNIEDGHVFKCELTVRGMRARKHQRPMEFTMKTIIAILLTITAVGPCFAGPALPSKEVSFLNEVSTAEDRGLEWLLKQQGPEGSWRHHPAMTALAATAILRIGRPLSTNEQAAVDKALKFVVSNVKTNGAIYGGDERDKYPNYSTAICSMALMASGKPEYTGIVVRAREFMLNSQFDESQGYGTNDASYGGIGYGNRQRPDLSNMQWALEALHQTESLDPSPATTKLHWDKAILFLQRCQNLSERNDQPWAKTAPVEDRGGFIYMPGDPAKGIPAMSNATDDDSVDEDTPLRSYASMTYAGLKSYLYADLKKDDPRVTVAMDWLRRTYTLDENPGVGKQGLYYYYHTMAKALSVYGDATIVDGKGKTHDWRYDLMKKLVTLQKGDGFWINDNNRWWENDPVLVTSYSLLALETAQAQHNP
jgi:squalene-hopene/tetraprenyl-beta-curcumene cyclase